MGPFCDLTGPLPDREDVLPPLGAAQIELVDCLKILGSICIQLAWKKFEKFFDRGGFHDSWEGRAFWVDTGGRVTTAPGIFLVTKCNGRGAATGAEKVFGERLNDGRVVTLATENVEVVVIRIVREMAADQRRRDQLHHGITGHAA